MSQDQPDHVNEVVWMDEILAPQSLDELRVLVESKVGPRLRKQLAKEFLRSCLYKNAEQWNRAVRLCETLTIAGWGDLEPVEATRGMFFNGNPETTFFNKFSETRFVDAIWSKRKAGLTMEQGRTSYHYSPDFLGGIQEQFEIWKLEDRFIEAHVTKIIGANWKIAQEAFSEAYHVNATHPQILPYLADTNSQVDVWENYSRVITAGLSTSPLLWYDVSEDDMMRGMLDVRVDQDSPIKIPAGQTARAVASASARDRWRSAVGDRVDSMSDSEMMDSIDYTIFPNMHPWGAFNRIVYRFRPNGDDHRSSIMEVFFLSPFSGKRPPNAKRRDLTIDEPFTNATELGMLAKVFQQDVFNMSKVQAGLETTWKPGVTLGNYQEVKVRWLHKLLGEFVNKDFTGRR